MGIIGIILFLAIGVGLARLFDVYVLSKRNDEVRTLQGEVLMEMLNNSETYANIRSRKELSDSGSDDRNSNHGYNVEQLGAGGDGEKVLRLRSGRKM
jgi:hypothetical protein